MVAKTTPTFPGFPLGVTAGNYAMTFNLLNPASYNPAFITSAFNPSGDNARALVVEHDPATRTVVFNEKPSPKHWGAHPIFSTPP